MKSHTQYTTRKTSHAGLNEYDILKHSTTDAKMQFLFFAPIENRFVLMDLKTGRLVHWAANPIELGYRPFVRALDWQRVEQSFQVTKQFPMLQSPFTMPVNPAFSADGFPLQTNYVL